MGGGPHLQISLEKYNEKESRRTNTDGSTGEADAHTHPLTPVVDPDIHSLLASSV